MITPPRWAAEQFEAERLKAISIFRKERIEEPLEDYLEAFDDHRGYVEQLLESTLDLSQLEERALDILTDGRLLEAPLPGSAADL